MCVCTRIQVHTSMLVCMCAFLFMHNSYEVIIGSVKLWTQSEGGRVFCNCWFCIDVLKSYRQSQRRFLLVSGRCYVGCLPKARLLNALFLQHRLSSLASSCGKFWKHPPPTPTPALRPWVSISTQSSKDKVHLWLYAPDHTPPHLTSMTNKTSLGFGFHSIFPPALSSKCLKRGISFDRCHCPVSFYVLTHHSWVSTFFFWKWLRTRLAPKYEIQWPLDLSDILSLFALWLQ